MLTQEELEKLSREQLIELLLIDSKNLVAMDGVWFQSVEREQGNGLRDAPRRGDMEALHPQ